MDSSSLHKLIDQLPPLLQKQVFDVTHFLLEKQGQPLPKKPRIMDLHKGQVWMSEGFDDALVMELDESGF
jgi:hypothetical protein